MWWNLKWWWIYNVSLIEFENVTEIKCKWEEMYLKTDNGIGKSENICGCPHKKVNLCISLYFYANKEIFDKPFRQTYFASFFRIKKGKFCVSSDV